MMEWKMVGMLAQLKVDRSVAQKVEKKVDNLAA
jgi:hypothetical protein